MAEAKFPTTPDEIQAYITQEKERAYQQGVTETAAQHKELVDQLQAKISLIENNPLEYPRFLNDKGEVYELTYLHPFSVKNDSGITEYQHEDFINDEAAKLKFNKTAEEVLTDLFAQRPTLFIKK